MKKIILSILVLFSFQLGNSQVLNQPANWPNTNWTTSGTYSENGLLANPTSADSFTFDDDEAGQTSNDVINSESPIIDLTNAFNAGESLILISGDYTHLDVGGILSVDYWDHDNELWVSIQELGGSNGATGQTYPNCTSLVSFEAGFDVSSFTVTQLTNFKYRFSYDDGDGWLYGWCIKNAYITSSEGYGVPDCDAVVTSPADGETGVALNPTVSWSSASGFPSGYYVSVGTTDGGNDVLDSTDVGDVNSYTLSGLDGSTNYFITILPYNGSGSATDACSSYSFTTAIDTSSSIDCNSGPITLDYCYGNNNTTDFTYTNADGVPVNLTINSGNVEAGWDVFSVYDSDGITLLYSGDGDISGLTFQSTGDTISFVVVSDGSISCEDSQFAPALANGINYTVACATCVSPEATYTVVDDCENGDQFFVEVDLTDIGSASSVTLSDNQGDTTQSATETGIYAFGPYDNNTGVVISITNDDDANCFISSDSITQEFCTTTSVDCSAGPITLDYCYGNNNTTDFTYTNADGVPVNLTINSGNVEAGWDVFSVYDSDGITLLYSGDGDISGLTFQSTGDTISFVVVSDGTVSCESSVAPYSAGINYTVACATCVNPEATYTVVDDCENGDQFLIDVDITSLGDANSLTISDNQGDTTQSATETGIYTFGPYPFLTDIIISIANDQDVNCVINSNAIQLFACPPANDNCNGAEEAIVNIDESCNLLTPGTLTAASESTDSSSCTGDDDDVWFEFTSLNEVQLISLINIEGSTTNLGHGLYEGECGSLTELYCSDDNSSVTTALTIGNTYYIKVFSSGNNSENIDFDLCIKDAPDNTVCENAANFCGQGGALYGSNVFDYPSLGQIACLYSTPNPSWNIIQIGDSGTIDIQIVQNTEFDEDGNAIGNGLDVDFVLWGPFDSNQNFCEEGVLEQGCPDPADCPNNTTNPDFYPSGNIIDCSYSIYDVENLTINDAQSGEIYVLLVTNYSNNAGTIQIEQTNNGNEGAGSTVAEIEVDLGDDIEICGTDTYELVANSTFADSYEWYQNESYIEGADGPSLVVSESDVYTVIVYDNQCDSYAQDSVSVNYQQIPIANFENELYEVCPNATIPIEVNIIADFENNADSYVISWNYNGNILPDENSLTLEVLNAGNYEFTITSTSIADCSYSYSINVMELESCVIPQGISPNDDGYNDTFDLSSYNVSSFKLFNRWGELVYSKVNYKNEWKGQSNQGDLLSVGTYFYVMNYDGDKTKVDWVYLNY